VPHFTAGWIQKIVHGDDLLSGGREFQGNPRTGAATARDAQVSIPIGATKGTSIPGQLPSIDRLAL
jgi:hypothetical protein